MTSLNALKNEIHLWCVNTSDLDYKIAKKHLICDLSADEIAKCNAYFFEKDKLSCLIGKSLVRRILSYYYPKIKPHEWCFSIGKYGKPFANHEQVSAAFSFNLSHSREFVVCAVCCFGEIGVDVEYIRKMDDMDSVAQNFSSCETEAIRRVQGHDKLELFYRIWTLKEAYVKAIGLGLTVPLSDFGFEFSDTDNIVLHVDSIPTSNNSVCFWSFDAPKEGYKLAVAVNNTERNDVVLRFMELNEWHCCKD